MASADSAMTDGAYESTLLPGSLLESNPMESTMMPQNNSTNSMDFCSALQTPKQEVMENPYMPTNPAVNKSNVATKSIENAYNKTPISTLQEYTQKIGKTPQYTLMATEGRSHQPQFVYTCKVGVHSTTGQGGSKKTAKHAAAEAVMQLLTSNLVQHQSSLDPSDDLKNLPVSTESSELIRTMPQTPDEANPVGSLQELVVSRSWRMPVYDLASENGPAHRKEFAICCEVESMKQHGYGTSKREAKRQAAILMYHHIVRLPPDAKDTVVRNGKNNGNKISFSKIFNSDLNQVCISPVSEEESQMDPRKYLEKLGLKHAFEVEYININQLNRNCLCQCFLRINLQPEAVVCGLGRTQEEANIDGASQGIRHLRIFNGI